MFDFGFWEIVMVLLVGLIVVGPERLPGLARTVGLWLGKVKRFVRDAKSEIDKELASEELKNALDKQNAMDDVYEIIEETKRTAGEVKQSLNNGIESNNTPQADKTISTNRDENPNRKTAS